MHGVASDIAPRRSPYGASTTPTPTRADAFELIQLDDGESLGEPLGDAVGLREGLSDGDPLGLEVIQKLVEHVQDAEHGSGRFTLARGKSGERVERAKQIRRTVDQYERLVPRRLGRAFHGRGLCANASGVIA